MIGFIYKTTCLTNGKIYIGRHEGKIDDNYLGSGTLLRIAIQKYGKENFKREILKVCNNVHELQIWEYFYIKRFHSQDPNIGYNIADGDVNTSGYNPSKREDVRARISKTLKEEYAQGLIPKEKIVHIGKDHWNYGKHLSEETKRKISESRKKWNKEHGFCRTGKTLSAESRKKMSLSLKRYYQEHPEERLKNGLHCKGKPGPMLGCPMSLETKRKLSEAQRKWAATHKKEKSLAMKGVMAGEKHWNYGKHLSEETKRKISEGYKRYWMNKRKSVKQNTV